jgi:D-glycero-alpha-D-manno-heptose 1-phosphate guanylyltransferase
MAPICEKPFLNYLLNFLTHYGVTHVIISTGHLAHKITDYYGSLGRNPTWDGAKLSFSHETSPLGTGGAIRLAMKQCKQKNVLVLNGDSFFDFDLPHLTTMHRVYKSHQTIALREVDDASRYGKVVLGSDHTIAEFQEKSTQPQEGSINAGIYIFNKEQFLKDTPVDEAFSLEKDFFPNAIKAANIRGFEYSGYFIDIGIPADYNKAQDDLKDFKYK